jgi:hypothetical protein
MLEHNHTRLILQRFSYNVASNSHICVDRNMSKALCLTSSVIRQTCAGSVATFSLGQRLLGPFPGRHSTPTIGNKHQIVAA